MWSAERRAKTRKLKNLDAFDYTPENFALFKEEIVRLRKVVAGLRNGQKSRSARFLERIAEYRKSNQVFADAVRAGYLVPSHNPSSPPASHGSPTRS